MILRETGDPWGRDIFLSQCYNLSNFGRGPLDEPTYQYKRLGLLVLDVFVCVEVLRPSQPNGVMSSAVSLPNHTFTGQA